METFTSTTAADMGPFTRSSEVGSSLVYSFTLAQSTITCGHQGFQPQLKINILSNTIETYLFNRLQEQNSKAIMCGTLKLNNRSDANQHEALDGLGVDGFTPLPASPAAQTILRNCSNSPFSCPVCSAFSSVSHTAEAMNQGGKNRGPQKRFCLLLRYGWMFPPSSIPLERRKPSIPGQGVFLCSAQTCLWCCAGGLTEYVAQVDSTTHTVH